MGVDFPANVSTNSGLYSLDLKFHSTESNRAVPILTFFARDGKFGLSSSTALYPPPIVSSSSVLVEQLNPS